MMNVRIVVSEDFSDNDVKRILHYPTPESVSISFGGTYHRRSIDELPPVILIAISQIGISIVGGFLAAVGEDAWKALKGFVYRASEARVKNQRPSLRMEIEFADCTAVLCGLEKAPNIPVALDLAITSLEQNGKCEDLWFLPDPPSWVTYEERLFLHNPRD